SSGRLSPGQLPPTHLTGIYTLDSILTGNWVDLQSAAIHLILPATALALLTTVTVIGYAVQLLLSGTIVVETVFFWPGIGEYATTSILALDFPSIMGITV